MPHSLRRRRVYLLEGGLSQTLGSLLPHFPALLCLPWETSGHLGQLEALAFSS